MAPTSRTHSHDGQAPHSHSGPGRPGGEPGTLTPAASSASVALDIGNGLGALVLLPSDRFRDREIEISRVDSHAPRTHTGVHERTTQKGTVLTAIFGSLPAGEYVIWEDATTAGPVVEVPDGAVAQIRLD